METTVSLIPEEFRINEPINQKIYLVNGELKEWDGATAQVYSTISSTSDYAPTLLGTVPDMGEREALEALNACCKSL